MDIQKETPLPRVVFCVYAPQDEEFFKDLERHLKLMLRRDLITIRSIIAGDNWQQAINEHLNAASIVLLLISPNFIASDNCYLVGMEQALQRYKNEQMKVIP